MRKVTLLTFLSTLILAVPLFAAGRAQTYVTYDDGGTIVKQAEDGQEVDARVNFPLYSGDEVTTSRRGRSEIRLSDGNVIALDRSTAIHFQSMFDNYDGDASQTVAQLRFGHVMILRLDGGKELLRLDTDSASYVAAEGATYSVDSDRGRDRVIVFEGSVEVRTPQRTTRIKAGEQADVDDSGEFGLVSQSVEGSSDFERWFLRRAERYGGGSSRYLDRSLAYADDDLNENGSWVYASGLSTWCWRPRVAAGWRPYYYGSWHHGRGALTWVSYEPWGWVPYHYGRWAYDPIYGWVWLPGSGYSPAWVYWMYGPSYVGWAPAGWYDCYRPYYNWCYRPYAQAGLDFGFGFFGRVRVNDIDLRPWTFINSGVLVSTRVDRAALTTDAIRERLQRGGAAGGFATVSGSPARFTRNELRDPATVSDVIARRGAATGGTGTVAGGNDMTPFFRRDPELANNVRERIVGSRPSDGARASIGAGAAGIPSGNTIGSGNDGHVSRGTIDRGGIRSGVPQGGGVLDGGAAAPTVDRGGRGDSNGTIERGLPRSDGSAGNVGSWRDSSGMPRRGSNDGSSSGSTTGRDSANAPRDGSTTVPVWRDRVPRGGTAPASGDQPATTSPDRPRDDASWRNRAGRGDGGSTAVPRDGGSASPRSNDSPSRGSDVPRRVIDSIGGARVTRGDGGQSSAGSSRGSSGSSHSSGGGGDRPQHSSPPPQPQPQPQPQHHDSGGSAKSDSGHVDRGHHD